MQAVLFAAFTVFVNNVLIGFIISLLSSCCRVSEVFVTVFKFVFMSFFTVMS